MLVLLNTTLYSRSSLDCAGIVLAFCAKNLTVLSRSASSCQLSVNSSRVYGTESAESRTAIIPIGLHPVAAWPGLWKIFRP